MSSDYDPQQFGLVKLGADGKSAAEENDATPEDILFEDGPASQPMAAQETGADEDEDGGWGALREPSGHFDAVEASTASQEPEPQPEPELAAPIETKPELLSVSDVLSEPKTPAQPVRQRPAPASPKKDGSARARLTARPPRIPAHRMARHHRPSGWMVPILVFTLSAGVSALMFLFFQNLPLASLALAMGVIGSLFTRILLR